ncbi:MAG TPA: hypothetical protein VKB93_27510 [Thermoanaerobaculia bacterium]|nr:hypothetical protein [Thermoanaerobaculia bacterium]
MAVVCREIQERIEERRNELREDCRNVSRTVSETICKWLPWPLDDLCDVVTRVITELVCALVWVVVTVVSWVTRIVCEVVHVVIFVVERLISLAEWLVNRVLSLPELLFCFLGVRPGRKRYRICPLVIADADGVPVVPVATIESQIAAAVRIYETCNVSVIASPVTVVTGRPHLADGPGCDFTGFFGENRFEYEHLSCCEGLFGSLKCLRFPSGLLWPRHVLKAIWVRDMPVKVGCYMPPESYVLVDAGAALDTLAHEMGHACDLLHRDDPSNLMSTGNHTGSNLSGTQCCTIRTSRFVTFL